MRLNPLLGMLVLIPILLTCKVLNAQTVVGQSSYPDQAEAFVASIQSPESSSFDAIFALSEHKDSAVVGYIYQGFHKSKNYNYFGSSASRGGTVSDRSIGVFGTFKYNEYLDLRGCLELEQEGNNGSNSSGLEYGLLDLHLPQYNNYMVGVRLGRVRNELGFYNATMDNPMARYMDIAPLAIYRPDLSDVINRGTGVQFYLRYDKLPYFDITLEASKVLPIGIPSPSIVATAKNSMLLGSFESSVPSESLHLFATSKDLRWMFRYDAFNTKVRYSHSSLDANLNLDMAVRLYGVRRYFYDWDITYEVLTADYTGGFWSTLRHNSSYSLAHNIVLRKQLNHNWTVYAGYNEWVTDNSDKSGVVSSSKSGIPAGFYYSKDSHFGVNYNFHNWKTRLSLHFIDGLATLPAEGNRANMIDPPTKDILLTASITYSF